MKKKVSFCVFFGYQTTDLSWIVEKKGKFLLQDEKRKYSLPPKSILFSLDEELTDKTPLQKLQEKKQQYQNFSVDLVTLHELCELEKNYSLEELASLCLDSDSSLWEKAFLCLSLSQAEELFCREKSGFKKLSEQEIQAQKTAKKIAQEKEQKKKQERDWAQSLKKGILPKIENPQDWENFQKKFYQFSLSYNNHPEKKYFIKLFSLPLEKEELEKILLKILRLMQINITWENFQAKQIGVCENYNNEVELQARQITQDYPTKFAEDNISQEHLHCYSIDSPTTQDFDDAISLEKTELGYFVRLHISNLADFIPLFSPIFRHLEKYISSCYPLLKTYHLLPPELAKNTFSLQQNQKKSVITFEWLVNLEHQIISQKIYPSIIKIKKNISYSTANQWIEQKEEWSFLKQLCQTWLKQRIQKGALHFQRKEISLNIENPDKIKLIERDTSSFSYLVVSELTVQANHWAASLFVQKKTPALFRWQPPYKVLGDKKKENLTLEDYIIPPASFTLNFDSHSGLGLDSYTQIASPIRRFQDFICQKILLCILRNEPPPFKEEYLLSILENLQDRTLEYASLERRILNYWKRKYIFQNQDQIFWIKVIRKQKTKTLVHFLELEMMQSVFAPPLEAKEVYPIKIQQITEDGSKIVIEICKEEQ